MQVTFRTARLAECYADHKKGVRAWDEKAARSYVLRINTLKVAKSVDDLRKIPPLRFHPMKGDMAGFYSITLVGRWRMVASFTDDAMTIVRV